MRPLAYVESVTQALYDTVRKQHSNVRFLRARLVESQDMLAAHEPMVKTMRTRLVEVSGDLDSNVAAVIIYYMPSECPSTVSVSVSIAVYVFAVREYRYRVVAGNVLKHIRSNSQGIHR